MYMEILRNEENIYIFNHIVTNGECSQFFLRKHPARRIMRTAQKEQLHMIFHDFLFKVCKIDMIRGSTLT